MYEFKPIRSKDAYEAALAELDGLMKMAPEPGTTEFDHLDLLATIIERYEQDAFPIERPDALSMIRFYMEQNNLKASDLADLLGDQSRAAAILERDAALTLPEIRALHKHWLIPVDVLIAD
ncbi:transcriptional regulator [Thalassospira sp.]|uniref:helix-turn-helix domain-containing protein n=1 Tax=Thalassospira sp. TaxID=1912094 RepID=UPI001B026832|nr:transcriptional regulator [Thalassospira sp.]MBO6519204.1 transcriptional regulator [Rhodospirillales bacterium]MBO6773860.1 transcriptional regulator [Thalassospira sp.]